MALGWTWPLVMHLGDAVPGDGGDNYSFLWNLWWMRHVLATPGLDYFHTTYLFYPFGASIADHPHTALPALIAATVLKPASIVTAQNLLLIAYVFANLTSMYALVWDMTRHRRAAILAGVTFGISPYLAGHLLGHFDLVAAWVLPAFALLLRRAVRSDSSRAGIGAGLVLAATAYTAYYYVVYIGLFAAVYLIAWLDWFHLSWSRRAQTPFTQRLRLVLLVAAGVCAAAAMWIVLSGGRLIHLGPIAVSAQVPQNALTAMWMCALGAAICTWRIIVRVDRVPPARARRALAIAAQVVVIFIVGTAPLLWQAARLVTQGAYVTPAYQWRSAPRGVDLVAPFVGPPFHPLLHWASRAYAMAHLDRIEAVGWLGVVPVLLLFAGRAARRATDDERIWRVVAAAFAVWAVGPFLTVAGFDTGLKLPETLARFVPFVANARMPGRAMVGVFMAVAVLIALRVSRAAGTLRRPAMQWLLIALVGLDFWDAPIPLTPLDSPAVYRELAAAVPGAVCEAPFGVGDGLSVGSGAQDRRILFYATQHEHPLVGGYIGRMPVDAAQRYLDMPLVGALLRISDGDPAPVGVMLAGSEQPCTYLVVDRASSSAALQSYVGRLPADRLATDERRDLYRLR